MNESRKIYFDKFKEIFSKHINRVVKKIKIKRKIKKLFDVNKHSR